uniref:Acyl transferase domain-containing protein n=1 Tax=Candidatus Kentrum sp. FW TaxID=2126338 RepID=A0A450T6F1_9GAMM|nr:MAG: Acyl transferase domain-containing protein [Candidatus Kentron sp. FW]
MNNYPKVDLFSSSGARQAHEPIAIIGMACRLPGGVDNIDEYWSFLRNGTDAITKLPKDRPRAEHRHHDSSYPELAGFLDKVDRFDAAFFRITPREAALTDPQQRLLLEVSWEALEHAGLNPESLKGSQTGVFVGIFSNDYRLLQVQRGQESDFYASTGNSFATASGRLSYFFDFHGPAVSIDTASSASLVAFHIACRSLQNNECHLALASGVNLILSPESTIAFSKAGMLSPDGRCKSFDASANGYVRGEGCGVIVLRRLADALANNDNILAVVRGSAINQDGASDGLTVPNGRAQEAVIRQALAVAGIKPDEVCYVEAHGSGTSVGDPIEGRALDAVYGGGGKRAGPLMVGSVKTNIGHLEAAAGIAGVMKAVLSLQHAHIPPNPHFTGLNPRLADWQVTIPTTGLTWESPGNVPRRAGVSSFGFSGTNAHVILEEAPAVSPEPVPEVAAGMERSAHILTLSAKNETALWELAGRYVDWLAANPTTPLADICFTAHTGRAHFEHRLAVVAESTPALGGALSTFVAGEPDGQSAAGIASQKRPKVAFLFTGQGSQYVGMGRELYETQPTFRRVIDRCDGILRRVWEKSLPDILYSGSREDAPLDQTIYLQPALFALEYALAELWRSWGVEPDYVLGHSIGEYVAACVAGVFSLEDGLELVAERGRLMQTTEPGEMIAIHGDPARVTAAVRPHAGEVSVAVINGAGNVVITGQRPAVRAVVEALPDIQSTRLTVSHAFHSPLMDPILADFEKAVGRKTLSPPRIGLISNVTGKPEQTLFTEPGYWRRHIRETVRFSDGLFSLQQQGIDIFIEIGPKPTLSGLGRSCLPEAKHWLPSLQPAFTDWQTILHSLGELYGQGFPIDWAGFERDYANARRRVVLPTYPFQRERYWIDEGPTPSLISQPPVSQCGEMPSVPYSGRPLAGAPSEQSITSPPRSASLPDRLAQADSDEQRRESAMAFVQNKMRKIMRIGSDRALPVERSFKELGFDSLMSAELIAELDRELKVRIPIERFIRAGNVYNVTTILLDDLSVPAAMASGEAIIEAATEVPSATEDGSDNGEAQDGPADFHDAASEIPQIHAIVTEQRRREVKVDEHWVYDFASCNYLGLDLHPEVMKAIPPALEKWGVHPSWTRAVASPSLYEELEQALADLMGAPSVLVFPAVTLLHAGVIPVLAGYDGVIFKDILAHRSIYEACRLAQMEGAEVIDFKHNDTVDLENKLARYPLERTKIIAIDGVYSMLGEYPPLPEFARLARTYNATVYLDDAHGMGVVGEDPTPEMPYGHKGNGIVRHFDLDYVRDRMVYVAGLSKSYSSFGAFITCTDEAMKDKCKTASTFIFSGPSPVASLASAITGIELNKTEGEAWRAQVYRLTHKLVTEAREMGFEVVNENYFPIVGVVIGNTEQVIAACKILWEYGILITPAIFPMVPPDRGLLRFSITAANTEREIDRALESLQAVRVELF